MKYLFKFKLEFLKSEYILQYRYVKISIKNNILIIFEIYCRSIQTIPNLSPKKGFKRYCHDVNITILIYIKYRYVFYAYERKVLHGVRTIDKPKHWTWTIKIPIGIIDRQGS